MYPHLPGIMLGNGSPIISITNQTISYSSGGITAAATAYRLANDGNAYRGLGSVAPSYSLIAPWDTQSATVGNYEVYVTGTGDTANLTGSALNTWLNLGTTQSWVLSASAGNVLSVTLTVQIRQVGTTTVLTSATITLSSSAA